MFELVRDINASQVKLLFGSFAFIGVLVAIGLCLLRRLDRDYGKKD